MLAQVRDSMKQYENDREPIFLSMAQVSDVSKEFVIWNSD